MARRNSVKYPLILEAVQKVELKQWELAEALLIECKEPEEGSQPTDQLEEASKELATYGYQYNRTTLSDLRTLAKNFPPERRHQGIGWTIHKTIGRADLMDRFVEWSEIEKLDPTRILARLFIHHLEDMNREGWNATWTAQQDEKLKALAEKIREAERQKEEATNDIEREQAAKEVHRLQNALHDEEQKNDPPRHMPRGELHNLPTGSNILTTLSLVSNLLANMGRARDTMQNALQEIEPRLETLDLLYVNNLIEVAITVQNNTAEVIKTLRTKLPDQRSARLLNVVND